MIGWDILLDLLIMLLAALVLGTIAEQLRQSAVLGYLAAGTIVGPHVLGLVSRGEHVRGIAELGVALLLFSIGLELSVRRLRRLGVVALAGGTLQVLTTMAVGGGVALLAGLGPRAAFAVGAMAALSSTACVLRVLADRGMLDSMHGRASLGILLVQDVAVIPLMLLVALMAGGGAEGVGPASLGRTVLLGALLVIGLIVVLNFVIPRVLQLERWARSRELPILLAIVLALGSAYAAHAAALSPAMGAFLAGVLLGGSPFASQIRADIASLRTVLLTVFFASIGLVGDPAWVVAHWPGVLSALVLLVLGKAFLAAMAARLAGAPVGVALATGLCLAQMGEFSFVIAELAWRPGRLLGEDWFNLMVSASILSLFLTPFLVGLAPRIGGLVGGRPIRLGSGPAPDADGEAGTAGGGGPAELLIVGFGPAGQAVAHALYRRHRERIVVVELSPRTAAIAGRLDLEVVIGDATSREVLEHAGVAHARVIAITLPDPAAVRAVVHLGRQLAPGASIVARSRYHLRRWEIELAGAHAVVDEEQQVGDRMAAIARRSLAAALRTERGGRAR